MSWLRRRGLPIARWRVVDQVLTERARHDDLGYTAHHDDQQIGLRLVDRAGVYATRARASGRSFDECRGDLIKATAVLIAAIESMDRKVAPKQRGRRTSP